MNNFILTNNPIMNPHNITNVSTVYNPYEAYRIQALMTLMADTNNSTNKDKKEETSDNSFRFISNGMAITMSNPSSSSSKSGDRKIKITHDSDDKDDKDKKEKENEELKKDWEQLKALIIQYIEIVKITRTRLDIKDDEGSDILKLYEFGNEVEKEEFNITRPQLEELKDQFAALLQNDIKVYGEVATIRT